MKRQSLLILILIVVAATGLPYLFADQVVGGVKQEAESLAGQIDLLRPKVVAARQLEQEIAAIRQNEAGLEGRLLTNDAFATIQRELEAAAAASGLRIRILEMAGEGPVKEYPQLQLFTARVQLDCTAGQYIAFLRLLEQHRLLIGLPDIDVQLPKDASVGGRPATVPDSRSFTPTLTLHFFGKAESNS